MISQKPERLFGRSNLTAQADGSSVLRGTYEQKLDRILESATGLIAQVGYARASMRAVAAEAGVSLAGLYHYVASKEKMLFLIQFRAFSSLLNNVREKLHGVTDPIEQLRVVVRVHVGYFAANMAAQKVCSHELDSLTGEAYEETRRLRRDYFDLTRSIVDRIFDEHAPDSTFDRYSATMSLFGMLNWLYRWYDPKRGRSPNGLATQIASQFLDGVLASNRTGKV